MIRWIVTDMDGTLLDQNDRISQRARECLLDCQEKGIKVILASGRSYSRLMSYAEELHMKEFGGRFIEVNGMAVYDLESGEREVIRRLTEQEIKELFLFCREQGTEVQCMQDRAVYYWIPEWQNALKEQERIERNLPEDYPRLGGAWSWINDSRAGYPLQVEVQDVGELPEHSNKVNCVADPATNRKIFENLRKHLGERYELVRTCPRLIEISPKGITKGKTLKRLMEQEGIKEDEVLVFGDGENDVEMFQQVTYSFAMGNAEDFIKQQARRVTKGNHEDGVAEVLEKILKGKPVL